MAVKKLQVIITGDSKGAERAMASTGKAASGLSSKFGKFSKVATAGFLAAGAGALAFAKKSANTFKTVGGDILRLERITGLTAEQASKLRFAFQQTGISVDAGARGIAAFSKKVNASKDGMADFGFKVRDAQGNLLPMNELLDRASDRLASMKDGAEKNALAMKLFGKGGLDLVKTFGKGSDALAKLSAEAEKYGLVLTKDNLAAVKKSVAAHRDQEAAMQGLQVQIGMHVLPLITKLTTAFATAVPKITKFATEHKGLAKVVGGVVLVALGAYIVSMGAAAAATIAASWPVLAVIAAVAALAVGLKWAYQNVDWFHDAVNNASKFITQTAVPALKQMWSWFAEKILPILKVVARFYATVFVAEIRVAIAYIGFLVRAAQVLWGYFSRNLLPIIRTVASFVGGQLRQAFQGAQIAIAYLSPKIAAVVNHFRSLAPAAKMVASFMGASFARSINVAKAAIGFLADRVHNLWNFLDRVVTAAKNAANAIKSIPSKIPGAGLVGKVGGFLDGVAANGGPIRSGQTFLVGERGPEIFTANQSGVIIPNDRIAMPSKRTASTAVGAVTSAPAAPLHLTIQVEGSVVTERKLVEVVRTGLIDIGRRTGRPVLAGLA